LRLTNCIDFGFGCNFGAIRRRPHSEESRDDTLFSAGADEPAAALDRDSVVWKTQKIRPLQANGPFRWIRLFLLFRLGDTLSKEEPYP
jgi:hypothetical protein